MEGGFGNFYYENHYDKDGRATLRRAPLRRTEAVQSDNMLPMADVTPIAESDPPSPRTSTRLDCNDDSDEIDEADGVLPPLTEDIKSIASGMGIGGAAAGGGLTRNGSCRSTKSVIQKKMVSREAFFAQAVLIYIISVACIVNLSIGTGPSHVWVALLSGCLGYILPEPKIRREKVRSVLDLPPNPADVEARL